MMKFHLMVRKEDYGYYGNIPLSLVLKFYPLVTDSYIVLFKIILKRLID